MADLITKRRRIATGFTLGAMPPINTLYRAFRGIVAGISSKDVAEPDRVEVGAGHIDMWWGDYTRAKRYVHARVYGSGAILVDFRNRSGTSYTDRAMLPHDLVELLVRLFND